MKKILTALAAAGILLAGAGAYAWAAEEGGHSQAEPTHFPIKHPRELAWSFAGPFGTYDRAQLQRGLKVYKEVCAACHSLSFVAFRNLADPGGPGYSVAQADAFAARLQKLFPDKTVERQDERYTSNDAKQIILASGIKKKQRRDKRLVDKVAAALILEQYMETHYWG